MGRFITILFGLFNMLGIASGQQIEVISSQMPLDSIINSQYFESHPRLSPAGDQLFFSRTNHPDNPAGVSDEGDIWFSNRTGDRWSVPIHAGKAVNNSQQNSAIGFLDGGEALLLNRQYNGSNNGFAVSFNRDNVWTEPRDIDIPYFKSQSEFQSASLSPDGSTIIFSIMSFGSFGVEDLYFSRLKADGTWSDLRNLGPTVNTKYQELTPFISPDGETVYFASNGHGGEGSLDIFWTKRVDDTWRNWTTPVNLGPLVNTIGSETSFSFLPQSDEAILVSTQNSDGYGDIKKVGIIYPEDVVVQQDSLVDHPMLSVAVPDTLSANTKEQEGPMFSGRVFNIKDNAPILAQLILISERDTISLNSSLSEGFSSSLDADVYRLRVTSADFLEYDTTFQIMEGASIISNFSLYPLEVGSTITLNHVLFERGTTNLLEGSEQDLEAVYRMLLDNPSIEILVAGHTDNQGNFKLNVKLSQDRVDQVIEYLVDKGVKRKRLSGKGWGPMKPIASNNNEETRRLNRRVEFTILKK